MKKLLIIGQGDIGINVQDVERFGIDEVQNLTMDEFAARDDFADCIIMKGLTETSDFMRRVLQINKSFGGGFISHCGVFRVGADIIRPVGREATDKSVAPVGSMGQIISAPTDYKYAPLRKPFILTDSALNIAPTLTEKEGLTKNAIFLARKLGLGESNSPPARESAKQGAPAVEPVGGKINFESLPPTASRCAMLALCDSPAGGELEPQNNLTINFLTPSSKIDPKIKSSMDAAELEKYVAENFPGVTATHNALDVCFTDSAEKKNIANAPRPDILICDNIDQANSLYKSLTIFAGFMVAGFIVGNENLPPVILTSRSDTKECKLWSVELVA